ncbi:S8 family peptidase [Flavobacteriaceae bacterium F08102]|nr:S8 family peptidase [Flavobacteriaceae bacterium F08102]
MKFNTIIKSLVAGLILMGCGAAKTTTTQTTTPNPVIEKPAVTAPLMTAKKAKLTEQQLRTWPHADLMTDSLPGMSLQKAYQFIQNKQGRTVIVGVIDSGIDIEHEDLKNVLWTNEKEIPNNGKDDDRNGYVDDVHGWNFLGGNAGQAVPEQLEVARLVKAWKPKFEGKTEAEIDPKDKADFEEYNRLTALIKEKTENANKIIAQYAPVKEILEKSYKTIKEKLGDKPMTLASLNDLKFDDETLEKGRMIFMNAINQGSKPEDAITEINEYLNHYKNQVESQYNIDFNGRLTNDDPEDFNDKDYGNNLVIGSKEDEIHGTHVAGIILAERGNGIGIDGVATNAKLMAIRAVPDGDERDKDVALAIRYAVDNGAKVINMSFGKSHSPNAEWVFDAIKYAAKKDVLLVNAAGNDAADLDVTDTFPTDSKNKIDEISDNVITVGSITRQYNENLVSSFSNYGQKNVDIFAPGSEIYSTIPMNKYKYLQGTSMAAPEVAGVATLIRSYYPKLTASQVKHILMNSGTPYNAEVKLPRSKTERANFSNLSVSGRILNAYEALKMADEMSNK